MGATPKPPLLSVGDSFPALREGERLGFSDLTSQSKGKTRMEEEEGPRKGGNGLGDRVPTQRGQAQGPGTPPQGENPSDAAGGGGRRGPGGKGDALPGARPPPRLFPWLLGSWFCSALACSPCRAGERARRGLREGKEGEGERTWMCKCLWGFSDKAIIKMPTSSCLANLHIPCCAL